MRAAVLGVGAVGARAARQLSAGGVFDETVVRARRSGAADDVATALGPGVRADGGPVLEIPDGVDVAVAALPRDLHRAAAEAAIAAHSHLVLPTDDDETLAALRELDDEARARHVTIVVGAAFAPGLSCLLAAQAGGWLHAVREIHVARTGQGGPCCARTRPGFRGRRTCWFPDPIGPVGCVPRTDTADRALLEEAFGPLARVTVRHGTPRGRDRRLKKRAGALGAIRVEVRGETGDGLDTIVLGAVDRTATAAGNVAAIAAERVVAAERGGVVGVARIGPVGAFLEDLRLRGVRAARFVGATGG